MLQKCQEMPNYVGRKQTIKNYAAIWGTETGGHRSAESLKTTFSADFRKTKLVLNVRTMNTTKFNSWLLGLALMAAATANFTSCKEDDNGDDTKATDCETILFGSGDSQQLTLTDLTSPIANIANSASWLSVSALDGLDASGHPVLCIESTNAANDDAEAVISVTAENGDCVRVTVRYSSMYPGDAYSGGNNTFITDWWTFKAIELQGFEHAQSAPWEVEGGVNIPEEMRLQVTPSQGWEMAFSYLNDNSLKGVRYFALYNKWSGQVRLYTYIEDPTSWGSDLLLNVYFGAATHNDMYPLYNLFEYGIPTCHVLDKSLSRQAKLVSAQRQTFQTWLSPYNHSSSLVPGWYCFEFDMSGYVPNGKDWLKRERNEPRFKFIAETNNNQSVSLKGSLKGDIKGTFEEPQVIQSGGANALSGIFSALGSGLSTISGMATNSIAGCGQYAYLMSHGGSEGLGGYLNPIKYWGGFACSIAGGLFKGLSSLAEDEVSYDTVPGKIDLTLDATLALDGYITSATANNLAPLAVSPVGIYSANGEKGHVGKGVWSLAEDPVVYIDKDDIISTQRGFNVLCTADGYSVSSFGEYDARIVYAFDPTSVKLNINQDLFRDIQDVTVTTNIGVFPNLKYGNTDKYRDMLMMGSRPTFSLADGKTSGTVNLSGKSTPCVWQVGLDELADGEYETKDNCTVVTQKTADGNGWQRFHGRLIDVENAGKQIIVDPQVYIPYSTDGNGQCTGIGYPTSPDFVVRVDVQFSALDDNGERKYFQFGKLYIPRVEIVDYEKMGEVYKRLKDYSAKCESNKAVNTLANNSAVPVRYPGGHKLIRKTLTLLEKVGM